MILYAVYDKGEPYESHPSIVGIYTSIDAAKAAGFSSLHMYLNTEERKDARGRRRNYCVWQELITGTVQSYSRVPDFEWTIEEIVPDIYKP